MTQENPTWGYLRVRGEFVFESEGAERDPQNHVA